MSDYNEITAIITTEEPAVAATLDELRYLVLQGKKGDTGDSAYDEAVKRGFEGTEAEWLASLKGEPGPRGFSPLVEVEETAAGHHVTFTDVGGETSFNIPNGPAGPDGVSPVVSVENITGGHRVTIEDAEHVNTFDVMDGEKGDRGIPGSPGVSPRITVTDITGGHRVTIQDGWGESTFDVMDGQGDGSAANAVLYTEQTLNDSQKAQARGNIGAGTYSKPSGGIPDSDIASAATWNAKGTYSKPSGGIPKSDLAAAVQTSLGKADTALQQHQSLTGYATETWVEGKGYQTAQQVQTAISGKLDTAQGAANAGKFMVVGNDGNIAPVTMTAWQGGSF